MLLIASLVLYGGKYFQDHFYTDAIVASKDAAVRSGPSAKDKIAFRLGEGIKVHILEDGDDWSRVVLNNGDMGWIETSQIAKVNQ